MISAFQNCSKFEDRRYFGKLHYPKENKVCTSYSVSDKVLEIQIWATLTFIGNKLFTEVYTKIQPVFI